MAVIKVKFKRAIAGENFGFRRGDVSTIEETRAKAWIEAGTCETFVEPTAAERETRTNMQTPVSSQAASGRQGRAKK